MMPREKNNVKRPSEFLRVSKIALAIHHRHRIDTTEEFKPKEESVIVTSVGMRPYFFSNIKATIYEKMTFYYDKKKYSPAQIE